MPTDPLSLEARLTEWLTGMIERQQVIHQRHPTDWTAGYLTALRGARAELLAASPREAPPAPTCATCEWNEPRYEGQIRCFNRHITGIAPVAFKPECKASEFGCSLHQPTPGGPQ